MFELAEENGDLKACGADSPAHQVSGKSCSLDKRSPLILLLARLAQTLSFVLRPLQQEFGCLIAQFLSSKPLIVGVIEVLIADLELLPSSLSARVVYVRDGLVGHVHWRGLIPCSLGSVRGLDFPGRLEMAYRNDIVYSPGFQ